jgi:hypothetical protein
LHLDAATEAETIEELTQHLDDRYRDLRAIGMPDSEATAQAWRELEGHPRLAQEISRARVVLPAAPIHDVSRRGVAAIWDDVVFAWRRLRHAPGFAVVALITITLTVGANTAILSVADAVLFRPLPYADPDGVSIIQMRDRKTGQQYTSTPYAFLQAINEGCPSVSEAGLIEGIYAFPGLPPTARATVDSPRARSLCRWCRRRRTTLNYSAPGPRAGVCSGTPTWVVKAGRPYSRTPPGSRCLVRTNRFLDEPSGLVT